MKKACIVTAYKNYPGGVETFNRYLEEVLIENNYSVDYCTYEKDKYNLYERIGVKIFGFPFITARTFQKNKYDLVIANGEFGFGLKDKKIINVFHGCSWGYLKVVKREISFLKRLSLLRVSIEQYFGSRHKYCVAVSEFAKNDLSRFGIKINSVIENCVDDNLFTYNPEEKTGFLSVASYNYYGKGFDVLEKIAKEIPERKIDIVTNHILENENLRKIENISNSDMPSVYNRYRIFILPSRYEALQITPLEAMACGLPVLISNVGLGPVLKRAIPEFVIEGYDNVAVQEYLRRIKLINANYNYYSNLAWEYVRKNNSKEVFMKNWSSIIRLVGND